MQKERIFRPRQNVTFGDLNSVQDFASKSFDDLIADLLISGRGYSGFNTTKASTTNLNVEPGRLYDSGKAFSVDTAQTISMTPYLPAVAKKIVTLVAYGQTLETDVEPRDFLINVTTRATEPQSVSMTRHRKAVISPVQGLEAADPLPPAIQEGYTPIATVVLSATGIESVLMRADTKVPELDEQSSGLSIIFNWQNTTGKIIDGLRSDIANLAKRLDTMATKAMVDALAKELTNSKARTEILASYIGILGGDLAAVKEEVNAINGERPDLPDMLTLYGADDFLTEDETDTAHADHLATTQEGIRFAHDASGVSLLEVDNPYNSQVTVDGTGLLAPKYSSVDGLVVGAQDQNSIAGEIPLADYQYTTWEMVQKTMSRQRVRYGDWFTVCTNSAFWRSGNYDPVSHIFTRNGETFEVESVGGILSLFHSFKRLRRVWVDTYEVPYWTAESTTSSISGSQIAQTFLQSQGRYCTGISLAFTKIGPTGNVTVAIAEVHEDGSPNLNSIIAKTTLSQASLKPFPANWTFAPLPPTYLRKGDRYAIVVITSGAHYVATANGNDYTSGTLFFGTDGAYMTGDLTKDLMFKVHHAKFERSSVTVDMKGLQLTGGINSIDILAPMVVPAATNLLFQVRVDGIWKDLSYNQEQEDAPSILSSLPPLLPFRMVLTGTVDMLPIINLSSSQVIVARPRTTFKHISTARTLPSGVTTKRVVVEIVTADFDAAYHTVTVKLRHGSGFTTVKTHDAYPAPTRVDNRPLGDKAYLHKFTFNLGTAIDSYKIQVEGTTTTATKTFHVEKRIDNAVN